MERKYLTPQTPKIVIINRNTPKKQDENVEVLTPKATSMSPDNFLEPRKPSSIRKPMKRIRSPTFEADSSPGKFCEEVVSDACCI